MDNFNLEDWEAELDDKNEADCNKRDIEHYESIGIPCDGMGNPLLNMID